MLEVVLEKLERERERERERNKQYKTKMLMPFGINLNILQFVIVNLVAFFLNNGRTHSHVK